MMVAGHLQIKNEKYYMVLELRTEQGERKTKWIGTGLAVKGNKRRAEAMLEETRTKYLSPVVNNKSQMPFAEYMGYWLEIVRPNLEENTYAGYKSNIEKKNCAVFQTKRCYARRNKSCSDSGILYILPDGFACQQ